MTLALTQSTSPSFSEYNLAEPILNCINTLGFTSPTPVQAAVIPAAMQGGDWIVSAQTGSGKTAAFLIPILQHIWNTIRSGNNTPSNAPCSLVICPTRELAQQVATDAINLIRGTKGIRVATIVGGTSYHRQRSDLKGAHLVIATPGRLVDWIDQGGVKLSRLYSLTLDEADRMLDLGFMDEITAIHKACAQRQQTLMFSATFTARETRLAAELMVKPQHIMLASNKEKHNNITQQLQWADNSHHQHQLLKHWLKDESIDQAVIFASTQVDSDRLAKELEAEGISAASLHGAMPQVLRNRRLDALRKGRTKILVATDVAARGIDVPSITHVFNYGLPMKPEDYVHRIGRTGRAGRNGIAVTFAQRIDSFKIRQIERYIERSIPITTIKGLEPQLTAEDFKKQANRGKTQARGRGSKNNSYRSNTQPANSHRRESRNTAHNTNKTGAEQRTSTAASEHNRFERRASPTEQTHRAFKDKHTSKDRTPRREFDNRRPEFRNNAESNSYTKPRTPPKLSF